MNCNYNEFTSSSSDAQNYTQVPTSFIPEQLHLSDQGSQVTEWLQKDAQGEEEQRSECKPSLSFATLHHVTRVTFTYIIRNLLIK